VILLETLYVAPPTLTAQAPVLAIVVPLLGACAAALAPSGRTGWMISVVAAMVGAWMSLAVACDVMRSGVVDYVLGGFDTPLGIALRVDAMGALIGLLIGAVGTLAAVFSGHSLVAEVRTEKHTLFQAGFLLCQAGLVGIVYTGDAFNAFVFLEISAIGTYALIAIGEARDRRALPAAFNYLILGTVGATLYVIGVGFLYAATGTLNMVDMAARLTTLDQNAAVQAGFAFIMVGLGIKAAMFPLHVWLPGAYAHSPSLISLFLAATGTKAAIYLMARFLFEVFPDGTAFGEMFLTWVLAPLAAAGAIVCSVQAVFEREIRRMLAFSSIAQVGFIFLGFALGSAQGLSASLFYMVAHGLMKATMFMALGGLAISIGARRLDDFAGVAREAPWTALAFAVGAASLVGTPLTMGFLAKWQLIEAAFIAGNYWIVAAMAAGSVLTVIYVGRMMEAIFFREPPPGAPRAKEAPVGVLVPLLLLAGLSIWFGIDASLPDRLAEAGAARLFEVRP
jgi:multicomponent Na+:H+ antiporter subunit D